MPVGVQAQFRAALASGDVDLCQKLHNVLFPHVPATDRAGAETAMHMARSQAEWLPDRARCYSHAWLVERGLPSQLPDRLKPEAERLYPRIVEAVFVSANTNSAALKPLAKIVQAEMCNVVEDCFANGDRDPELVRSRMLDARARTVQQLLGTTLGGLKNG